MENNSDSQKKGDTPQKVSHRKRWSTLIIWPTLVVTIIIFIHYMAPPNQKSPIPPEPPNSPKGKIHSIEAAMETFLLNTGQYPATLNDLVQNPGLEGWAGPYLRESQLHDQSGKLFIYDPNKYKVNIQKIINYRSDGKPGGEGYDKDIPNK